jgi:hypothetical protein
MPCSIALRGLRPFSPLTYLGMTWILGHQSSPITEHQYVYPSTVSITGDTIRLLEIQPGRQPEALRCRLVEFSLSTDPVYSAISYEWGISNVYVTISLNNKPFGIRPNLWAFLMHIRDPELTKVVWVDAVCINQNDMTERGAQVAMMGEIYNRAQSVLIWLGARESRIRSSLMAINELFREQGLDFATVLVCGLVQHDELGNVVGRVGAEGVLANACKAGQAQRAVVVDLCSTILEICERSYWSRTWIIQEVALARDKTVYCGSSALPWSIFRNFCELAANFALHYGNEIEGTFDLKQGVPQLKSGAEVGWDFDAEQVISRCSLLIHTRAMIFNSRAESDLLDLLESIMESACSDPRDKVYALLNLSSNRSILPLPDYNKSSADLLFDVASCYQDRTVELACILQSAFRLTESNALASHLRRKEDNFFDTLHGYAAVSQILYTSRGAAQPLQFVLLRVPNKDLFFGEAEFLGMNSIQVSDRKDNNGFVIALLYGSARVGDGVYRMPFSTTLFVCRIQGESVIDAHVSVIGRLHPIDTASTYSHSLPLSEKSLKSVEIVESVMNAEASVYSLTASFDRQLLLEAMDTKIYGS